MGIIPNGTKQLAPNVVCEASHVCTQTQTHKFEKTHVTKCQKKILETFAGALIALLFCLDGFITLDPTRFI